MKRNTILRISILPIVLFTVVSFTNFQKKDHGDKPQQQSEEKGKDQKQKGNDNNSQGKTNQEKDQNKGKGNSGQGDNSGKEDDHNGNDNSGKGDDHNGKDNSGKGNDHEGKGNSNKDHNSNADHSKANHGNGNSKILNGKRDSDIDWNLNDFANRKHPKDQKKVTICHHPSGDASRAVTINISENASHAHLGHGDQMGTCTVNNSDRWSSNYIKSRENVYNTYEQTYETMSYSEAILKLALNKLLGITTNLDASRTTLSAQEIQRREALLLDLQSNVTSLESQLNLTRQQMDSNVNIIITL